MAAYFETMTRRRGTTRRGVLLLIVLSMLSLFMMLGVAYVVMASRARDASRGFAKLIAPSAGSHVPSEQLLDSAAMLVIRGTAAGARAAPLELKGGSPVSFESLLEDQYGSAAPVTGTVRAAGGSPPLCSVSVTLNSGSTSPTNPVQLSGRVLTFLPSAGKASSHRILRATADSSGYTLWIAIVGNDFAKRQNGQASSSSYTFPPEGTKIVINSRERAGVMPYAEKNEPWDGYDFAQNPFLAHLEPVPATPSTATVVRASMINASGTAIDAKDVDNDLVPDQCDNDNDGIIDGQFFDPGFPTLTAANGNTIVTHVSCLIVDLDGRLNANAHGSIASAIYPTSHTGWPATPPSAPPGGWSAMPLGSGYGPAEINGAQALSAFDALRAAGTHADTPWTNLFLGAQPRLQYGGEQQSSAAPEQGCRVAPLGLPSLEGRYAGTAQASPLSANGATIAVQVALPGVNGINDTLSTYNEQQFTGVRSPIDLQGRMKSLAIPATTGGGVPTLIFAKPENSPEFTDDPYEIVLARAKGGGILANPRTSGTAVGSTPDNVFSIAELERVLRPYDSDSATLPPRLFALLGSQAEIGRLAITTESWDVPVISGSAALTLFGTSGWFSSVKPSTSLYSTTGPSTATSGTIPDGVVPPDLAAGFKLNVTLAGTSTLSGTTTTDLQRRALFKDLYLTCVACLTGSGNPSAAVAAQYAQWAANVVEYQDSDSSMTQYEYDTRPHDGWSVSGTARAVVWGAERPEVVITQTLAWEDGKDWELFVMLHDPWNSRLEIPGQLPRNAEPPDPALQSSGTASDSSIDLGGTSPSGDPIWQLRIGTSSSDPIIRFDPIKPGSIAPGTTVLSGTSTPTLSCGGWLCVRPSAPSPQGITVSTGMNVQSFTFTSGTVKITSGTTVVRLERLANPNLDFDATTNPYLIIDAADVRVVSRALPTPSSHEVMTRNQGWRQLFTSSAPGNPAISGTWGGSPAWMMWPNRPLVSIAELMHVPGFIASGSTPNSFNPQLSTTGTPAGMLANYALPKDLDYLPDPSLLEVLRVPSRFSGTRLTIPNTTANAQSLTNLNSIGLYAPIAEFNQIDLGREPGRVNVNTISSDAVWNAVVVGGTTAGSVPLRNTVQTVSGSAASAKTLLDVLAVSSSGSAAASFQNTTADYPDANDNPLHKMHTATRLANMATNRSHVFGVWVTLRTMESAGGTVDPDSAQYHRMFFIYDRSKPVAFEPGKDHNVRDGILLKRVLQ